MIIAVEYSHRGFDVVGEREFDVVRGFFDSGMTHKEGKRNVKENRLEKAMVRFVFYLLFY